MRRGLVAWPSRRGKMCERAERSSDPQSNATYVVGLYHLDPHAYAWGWTGVRRALSGPGESLGLAAGE